MYVALYRKWRPKTFEDVVGQEQITKTLKNEIRQGKIAHAYLFCGTRGTGKTSTAKLLAKALNCENPQNLNPCDQCDSCQSINQGNSIDVFEIDAASNRGIDDIRNLREAVRFTPTSKYKIYIIDEVHMLTNEAFNALLKTLEEPPPYVIFILATTEPHKLLPTILSRCQRFDFKRIGTDCLIDRMQSICDIEGIKVDEESLMLIARNSDGAMRDALTMLDQCAVYCGNQITYEDVSTVLGVAGDKMIFRLADAVAKEDFGAAIVLIDEAVNGGRDISQMIKEMTLHYRNLLMAKLIEHIEEMSDLSKDTVADLKVQEKLYTRDHLMFCIQCLTEGEFGAKNTTLPRVILEITVAKMCRPKADRTPEGVLSRLSQLESKLENPGLFMAAESQASYPVNAVPERKKVAPKEHLKRIHIKEPLTETIIKQKWSGFLGYLKEQKMMKYRTFLATAKPMSKEDGTIILSYSQDDRFAKEAIEKPTTKAELERLAGEYFQTEVHLKTMMDGEYENLVVKESDGDKIQELIDIFGEDLVEVIEDEDNDLK